MAASKFALQLLTTLRPFLKDGASQQMLLNSIDIALLPYWDALSHAKSIQHPEWAKCSEYPKVEESLKELRPPTMSDTKPVESETRLLPCPFAHTPEQISRFENSTPYVTDSMSEDGTWCVYCPACSSASGFYDDKDSAIATWQGRVPSSVTTDAVPIRPKIICLCGSTRFIDTWISEYQRLSDEGNIVLTVARMPPRPNLQHEEPELKQRLDGLHLHKIKLADEVFVLNVDGYIGESTRNEINYAQSLNKVIRYLSAEGDKNSGQAGKEPFSQTSAVGKTVTRPLAMDDDAKVFYPGIVDQKTLAACLGTAEQVIRNPRNDGIARFHRTKAKLIAQVKAHPMSFDEWNNGSPSSEYRRSLVEKYPERKSL